MALEKDWVPVLCQGNKALLTTINGRMRRIDLFCKLMAPALFGVVTQFLGDTPEQKIRYGASWVLLWNVLGVFVEYSTVRRAYTANPILGTHALKGQLGGPAVGTSSDSLSASPSADYEVNFVKKDYGAVKADGEGPAVEDNGASKVLVVNDASSSDLDDDSNAIKKIESEQGLLNGSKPHKCAKKENNFSFEFTLHCHLCPWNEWNHQTGRWLLNVILSVIVRDCVSV